jgi:outer membrane protein assembly factor BamD
MVKIYLFYLLFVCLSCSNSSYIVKDENSEEKLNSVVEYIKKEKYSKAKIEIEYLLLLDPLSNFSGDAQYYLSDCYFYLNDYGQAIIEYSKYLSRQDSKDEFVKKAKYMLCKCYFNMSLDFKKDQTDTVIAIEKLQNFIEEDIMSDYISEIENMILDLRNKLAKKDFYTASLYIKLEEIESANIYYLSIIDNYYDTDYVNDALINMTLLCFINDTDAEEFLKNYKNNFLTNDDYEDTMALIKNLSLGEDYDYYISLLK